MKEQFFRVLAVLSFVFAFASFGGYENGMFGIIRCLLQMLFFFIVGGIFAILAENEYIRKGNDKND